MSLELVADGFGRFGLDGVGDGVEGSSPSSVVGQGSVSLVVDEMVGGLVLSWKVRGGTEGKG